MPSSRKEKYLINIAGQEVELSRDCVNFYLKETKRRAPTKKSLEKFFSNLVKYFTDNVS